MAKRKPWSQINSALLGFPMTGRPGGMVPSPRLTGHQHKTNSLICKPTTVKASNSNETGVKSRVRVLLEADVKKASKSQVTREEAT